MGNTAQSFCFGMEMALCSLQALSKLVLPPLDVALSDSATAVTSL